MMTGKSERLATKPAKVKKVAKKEEVKKETEEIETPKEKIETVQKVEKEIIKKPELKKVEISKPISKAPQKSEEESENLENPNKIVPKRKGLVIIKKKRPKEEELEGPIFSKQTYSRWKEELAKARTQQLTIITLL